MDFGAFWGPDVQIFVFEGQFSSFLNERKSLNLVYLNKLIDYSMAFPFYQGLNPLLNGKSNKDTPLSSDRRRARAGPWGGVGPETLN